jgi:hypothetical protein
VKERGIVLFSYPQVGNQDCTAHAKGLGVILNRFTAAGFEVRARPLWQGCLCCKYTVQPWRLDHARHMMCDLINPSKPLCFMSAHKTQG